jgi:hypothetical protein
MSHPCGVCKELEGDRTPKATAKWCGVCHTYICDDCEPNLLRRGMAMAIVKARRLRFRKVAEERRVLRDSQITNPPPTS